MECEKLFASPINPCFTSLLKTCDSRLSIDTLEDWIKHFQKLSKSAVKERTWKYTTPFRFVCKTVVKMTYIICEKFEQPHEVRFMSVDIFDRFMMRHFTELFERVYKKSRKKENNRMWEKVLGRVRNQVLLRLVSCVQLASKLHTHYQVLSPKKISQFLLECGHCFTKKSIMSSEIRVFKTLDFKLPINSPLVIVETLLALLVEDYRKCSDPSNEEEALGPLYGISLQVLDVAFMFHEELYASLYENVTGRKGPPESDRSDFLDVECNLLFLAAGVVCCAAYLHAYKGPTLADKVLRYISYTVGIPRKDIALLSAVLCELGKKLD